MKAVSRSKTFINHCLDVIFERITGDIEQASKKT